MSGMGQAGRQLALAAALAAATDGLPAKASKVSRTDTFTARRKAEKAKARIRKGKNPWR